MPPDEKDKAATNRLLDLLRSQQAGTPTTTGNESGTIDDKPDESAPEAKKPTEKPEAPPEKKEIPEPPPVVAKEPDPEPEPEPEEDPTPAKEVSKEEERAAIQAKLGMLANLGDSKPEPPPVEEVEPVQKAEETPADPVPETPPADKAPAGLAGALAGLKGKVAEKEDKPVPEPEPEVTPEPEETAPVPAAPVAGENEVADFAAIVDTPAPEDAPEVPQEDQLPPATIDPKHFQAGGSDEAPNKLQEIVGNTKAWLNGATRRLSVYSTTGSIRIMKFHNQGEKLVVESANTYTLPYEIGDRRFLQREELLDHLLEIEDDKLWRRQSYVAVNSTAADSLTRIFTPPDAKGKELAELITWTAKKNIPFNAESAILDSEQIYSESSAKAAKQYAIAVGNGETIERITDLYTDKKYNLRLITTLPYLNWKLFMENYPDRNRGTVGLVNIGETQTTISMIKFGRMQFTRDMSVGLQDYFRAVQQRVVVGNDSFQIDEEASRQYVLDYGIPKETDGVIPGTGISLYKISIFLRPVIERMTTELNRSLDYFKKQDAELDCQELYFTGPGASIPNLIEDFHEQLNRHTFYLNPLRSGHISFSEDLELPLKEIPSFSNNIALALDSSKHLNLLPPYRKQHYLFRLLNRFAGIVAAFLIPLLILSGVFSYLETKRLEENVSSLNRQWDLLSEQAQEYFNMINDLEIMSSYWTYLKSDHINSENQLKLLRLLSSEIPSNIKLTSVLFRPAASSGSNNSQRDPAIKSLEMSGFVDAHAGVADIQLTNFIMRLDGLNIFTTINREDRSSSSAEGRLLFTLRLGL